MGKTRMSDVLQKIQEQIEKMRRQGVGQIMGVDIAQPSSASSAAEIQAQSALTTEKLHAMMQQQQMHVWNQPRPKTEGEIQNERLTDVERRLDELTRYAEFNATHDPITLEAFRKIEAVTAKIEESVAPGATVQFAGVDVARGVTEIHWEVR
jgi:DNA repair exonuclease SbcCD ATPase subunit